METPGFFEIYATAILMNEAADETTLIRRCVADAQQPDGCCGALCEPLAEDQASRSGTSSVVGYDPAGPVALIGQAMADRQRVEESYFDSHSRGAAPSPSSFAPGALEVKRFTRDGWILVWLSGAAMAACRLLNTICGRFVRVRHSCVGSGNNAFTETVRIHLSKFRTVQQDLR